MTEPLNRVRYFTGQFLREKDFTDEQNYHVGMRQGHNRTLHTPGVVEGLQLGFDAGTDLLRVTQGAALDPKGREIPLGQDWSDNVTKYKGAADTVHAVVILFGEDEGEPSPDAPADAKGNFDTRLVPAPRIAVLAPDAAPDADAVALGRVTIGADGKIKTTDAGDGAALRRLAGTRGGNMGAVTLDLGGVDLAKKPRLSATVDGRLDVQGALAVSGTATAAAVGINTGTAAPRAPLEVNGAIWSTLDSKNPNPNPRDGVFLGTYAAAGLNPGGFPLSLPAEAQGMTVTNSTDGAFFGLVSRGAFNNDYNAVIAWGDDADDLLQFRWNNKNLVTVAPSGNVGIGTATPSAPLDVGGQALNAVQAVLARGHADGNFQLQALNGQGDKAGDVQASFGLQYAGAGEVAGFGFVRGQQAQDGALTIRTNKAERLRVDATGNVGIGTAAPAHTLEVNGTINATAILVNGAVIGGTQWAGGANGALFYNGGRVGVGTATPGMQFHASTSMAAGPVAFGDAVGRVVASGATAEFTFLRRDLTAWPQSPQAGDRYVWYANGTAGNTAATLWTEGVGDLLKVTPAGQLGIGTGPAMPAAPLDLGGNRENGLQAILTRGADPKFQLQAVNGKGNNPGDTVSYFGLQYDGVGETALLGFIRGTGTQDGALAIHTNKAERLRVDAGGNVGIGTATPHAKLEVNGPIWSTLDSKNPNPNPRDGVFLGTYAAAGLNPGSFPLSLPAEAQGMTVTNSTDGAFFGLISRGAFNNDYNAVIAWGDDADDLLQFRHNNNTLVTVVPNGNVGIGTATPAHTLDVNGTINATAVLVNGAPVGAGGGQWAAGPGNTISYSAGNVGIGTTTPAAALDVGGNRDNNLQAILTRGSGDANFQLVALNGQGNNPGDTVATFGLQYAGLGDAVRWGKGEAAVFSFIRGVMGQEGSLAIRTNKAERLRVDAGGNVGIGTATPHAKLEVNGPIWSTLDSKGANPNPRDGVFLGTYAAAGLNPGNFPVYLPAEAQGMTVTNTTDGAFFGLISRGAFNNDYNAVIAWGDDNDDMLEFRFNNKPVVRVNPNGTIFARGGTQTLQGDVAEIYHSDAGLQAGDVVILDPDADRITLSRTACDGHVIGIVSSEPGVLLNVAEEPAPAAGGRTGYPVALCGRVPCKVTDENGPIRRGDRLTASSKPGHAMRAEPIRVGGEAIYRPGTLIGKALEAHGAGDGTIEVFVTLQ